MALHWFYQIGAAVYFDHDHDVFVSTFGSGWELSSLVGECSFTDIVCRYVDVLDLFPSHIWILGNFEWDSFHFGGSYIFSCLIHMPFDCFVGLGVIFAYIAFS